MGKKSKGADFVGKIPKGVWLLISLVVALILWTVLSIIPSTSRCFPNAIKVIGSIQTMVSRGLLFKDIGSSLISVLLGFLIGFVTAVPVAFLMAWYRPVRFIIEPWIQFIRNIPPLAYVPLVVIGVGVGRTPQVIVIWLATFLTMTVTIFQGVINVDETLIKAARVLGAKDSDLFVKVIFPATALTTLIAAESTGAVAGLGMRIKALSNSYETTPMLLYIIIIGIIGMLAEKILKYFERKLTGWQEKREI